MRQKAVLVLCALLSAAAARAQVRATPGRAPATLSLPALPALPAALAKAAAPLSESALHRQLLEKGFVGDNGITRQEFGRWMSQFRGKDRKTAALVLSRMRFISPEQTRRELASLYDGRIVPALARDGFLPNENPSRARTTLYAKKDAAGGVDFSMIGSHKSGAPIGYTFRVTNRLPQILFGPTERFLIDGKSKNGRALVLIDNEIGSGLQALYFLSTSLQKKLFPRYKKIYVATLEASQKAVDRFALLAQGRHEEVAEALTRRIKQNDDSVKRAMRRQLAKLSGGKLELLPLIVEPFEPLLEGLGEARRKEVKLFLEKYGGYHMFGGQPYGVGGALGRRVLAAVQPSNSLPDFLFLPVPGRKPQKQLFRRVEDGTTYEVSLTKKLRELPAGERLRSMVYSPKPRAK